MINLNFKNLFTGSLANSPMNIPDNFHENSMKTEGGWAFWKILPSNVKLSPFINQGNDQK